jgi:hypothetical protein
MTKGLQSRILDALMKPARRRAGVRRRRQEVGHYRGIFLIWYRQIKPVSPIP